MKRIIVKACPFCAEYGEWSCVPQEDGTTLWAYGCTNEDCEVRPTTDYYESQNEVASVWNSRPNQPKEIWAMEFVFNEEKAQALGYTAQACYDKVDRIFSKYGINPEEQGVYVTVESQNAFTAFGVVHKLYYTDWFLKTIDKWFWYENSDVPVDCLQKQAEIEKITSGRR